MLVICNYYLVSNSGNLIKVCKNKSLLYNFRFQLLLSYFNY